MLLQEKINRLSALKEEKKIIKKEIKKLNKEIKDEQDSLKFDGFDPILKKYYSFDLPNKKGDDWTDLTGWHGSNSREMAEKLETLFEGHEPYDRHVEFDVFDTVFEDGGVLEGYLSEELSEEIINKLNLYIEDSYLMNFDGLNEIEIKLIKNFIDMYTSIQVNSCINDW